MQKTIVIVGGSGSIGKSIAEEVIKKGFVPYLIGRNFSSLSDLSKKLNCKFSKADVSDNEEFEDALKKTDDTVHGLAYCAGSIDLKPLSSSHPNDYIESFKVNTIGAAMAAKYLKNTLTKNKGSIIFFSSIAASQGFPNHTIVATSKGAIESLTVSLAADFAPEIKVNCIAPSLTETGMTTSIISNPSIKKAIENLHPIPRLGQPRDHGKLATYLLCEPNNWITGQIFNVDGGRSTIRKKG